MVIMSLKSQCVKNIVDLIQNLPPRLKEEIVGESLNSMKEKIMKQMRRDANIVIEDIVDKIISAHRTGVDWKRPDYTNDIDNELYFMYVDIAGRLIDKFWSVGFGGEGRRYNSFEESEEEYD